MSEACSQMTPSRRAALGAAGALFGWSFLPRFAFAAGARDARLIVVVLRGALDGLAAVPPIGDPAYAGLRGPLALAATGEGAALPLDGFFAAHPATPVFALLFRAKQALIVHAAATGYRERSHFDGQDVLESGRNAPAMVESGWLNRVVAALPAGAPTARRGALGVGVTAPLIVRGPAPVLGWAPPNLPPAGDDLIRRLGDLYGQTDPALSRALARAVETEAIASAQKLGGAENRARGGPATPQGMAQIAAAAARLVAAEDGPRIAALAFEGWDTHADEGGATGRLATLLGGLDQAFAAFESGLKAVWADTAILVLTEFGRTARINGTIGTDHGVGTVAYVVGGAVRGGRVVADWPGLKDEQLYERRDLKPTTDVRAVCKGVVADLFGLSGMVLAERIFPDTAAILPMKGLVA